MEGRLKEQGGKLRSSSKLRAVLVKSPNEVESGLAGVIVDYLCKGEAKMDAALLTLDWIDDWEVAEVTQRRIRLCLAWEDISEVEFLKQLPIPCTVTTFPSFLSEKFKLNPQQTSTVSHLAFQQSENICDIPAAIGHWRTRSQINITHQLETITAEFTLAEICEIGHNTKPVSNEFLDLSEFLSKLEGKLGYSLSPEQNWQWNSRRINRRK